LEKTLKVKKNQKTEIQGLRYRFLKCCGLRFDFLHAFFRGLIRIRKFLGLPYPDPLVRCIPFSHKGIERTEIMLANFDTKF
jgi:hypothetical protein